MTQPLLVLAPHGRDAGVIQQVLLSSGLNVLTCPDLPTTLERLGASSAAILTEESLAGAALPGIYDWVEQQPAWSDLPFIILATRQNGPRSKDNASLLDRLGNAVLLERPLNAETLVSAGRAALRARRRQLAMRELAETLEERVAERTQALAETEARFRAVFEGFPEPMFVVRPAGEGQFLFEGYNPAAEHALGHSLAQVSGQAAGAFMDPAAARSIDARFRECLEQGSLAFTEDVQANSGTLTYDTTLTRLPGAEGQASRILGVSHDVTERNRLAERVRQSEKLEVIGQLTGGVAHDFNNLLQVVLSGLALMERTENPARRIQLADSIRRAAQRGGELTKRLLTVARRSALRPQPIDLESWTDDGMGELLSRTLRGDIRTLIQIPPGLPPIEADPAELELAVLNLAVNSRDAMPEGGTLTVRAVLLDREAAEQEGLRGDFVSLSISDTGTGMAPDTQARVFEPFFTTKEVGKGTGLGLAQVYGFARQSGGNVRLQSTLGAGTTVSLLLPVSRRRPAVARRAADQATVPLRGAAVLVCEDDDEVGALVIDMLVQLGHTPTRVTTAASALGALADGRKVDLLFSDVMMPGGMDGLALAREAGRRRPGLPVLLTTGYTGGPSAVPIGVPVLLKPYRLEDLAEALQRALPMAPDLPRVAGSG